MPVKVELLFGFALGFAFTLFAFSTFTEMGGFNKTVVKSYLPEVNGSEPSCKNDTSLLKTFVNGMESLQHERRQMLAFACNRYHPTIVMSPYKPFLNSLYNKKYGFSICRIQKVASSSWLRAVMVTDGFYTRKQLEEEKVKGDRVIEYTKKQRRISTVKSYADRFKLWRNSTNIITVRDPMSRIVSAYVDKMVRGKSPVYTKLRRYVELKYRPIRTNVTERNLKFNHTTFEDFVNFLVDTTSKSSSRRDAHWRSYYPLCMPCSYKYDAIIKLETLTEDSAYLHEKLNIASADRSLIIPGQPASNLRAAFTGPGGSMSVAEFFDGLPPHLRKAVYDVYRFDFDAFGYEPPKWK